MESSIPEDIIEAVAKEPLIKLAFVGALGSMLSANLLSTVKGEETQPSWIMWFMMLIMFAAITKHPILKRKARA